ncbi:unnamed protein product [Dovyalis caffra]|uniref:Uncharacterized protein n=1 Tax=Dovyalis caffra TaxID=77055 RepID=A0AAV1SJC4_9ROSI|nr:unnamed protein product [Dovyalis caffra]
MVDAVVNVFLERLLNTLVEEGRVVNEFRDQFERLQNELQLMQCFLKDADEQKRKNQTLLGIMANLHELIYESEDILTDCQLQSMEDNQFSNGYLIVMDDVWNLDGNWWSRISEGLPKGNGSSFIITTRLVKVLRKMQVSEDRMHQPEILNNYDSWLLFRKLAFAASGGECTNPELEKVGKEIVQKCNNLPLAIKEIGRMLLYKSHYHEWKRIADNFRDELGQNDDTVMPSVQLSYDELPSYLKSCFLSFSLYPEDFVITKEQLVHWWIEEGFVPVRSGRLSTEVGKIVSQV